MAAAKKEYMGKDNAWTTDRAELVTKLNEVSAQLAHWQAESLKSFEEGYGECCAHFAGVRVEVKNNTINCYLADL